ncbi:ImmA/IrrE family metallo-endopeptidase [Sporosarcina soli]|uniref:ImmA/IrrE family metallo-endopeptidase n=1 Tax=Sporosarcina soli TaxID=334736 RepID=A0ABW0TS63_9BACL
MFHLVSKGVEDELKISNLTFLEEKILSIYHSLNITEPGFYNSKELINSFSEKFGIKTYYFDESSEANNLGGEYRIFLNVNQNPQKIWQDFAHELGHIIRHDGCQCSMGIPFREFQEWQAESFAFHFCVPTFMLDLLELPQLRCEAVELIARLFNVETTFADVRLEKWLQSREIYL